MGNMKQLSLVIGHLRNLADSLEDLCQGVEHITPESVETTEPKETKQVVEEPTVTVAIEDIRKVLAEKSQAGKTDKVRELLQRYGANKLSEVEVNQYPSLLDDAKGL
ncbi:TPA: rRNA biogenesis protein rrp5 [Streptococcus suis]|nr:rRNA biogenesis protein rrp5 [Streptococcus suis]